VPRISNKTQNGKKAKSEIIGGCDKNVYVRIRGGRWRSWSIRVWGVCCKGYGRSNMQGWKKCLRIQRICEANQWR